MSRLLCLTVTCLLIFVFAGYAAADGDEYPITKKLGGQNYQMALATNSKTGDVLVVWVHVPDSDNPERVVYASLCKRLSSGKYRVKKPKLVMTAGTGMVYNPTVAFNTAENRYYVVWKQTPGLITIFGRKVSAKGRPLHKAEPLPFNYLDQRQPLLYSLGNKSAAPGESAFLLLYATYPSSATQEQLRGCWTVLLDSDGGFIGEPAMISQGYAPDKTPYYGFAWPTAVDRAKDGTFLVGVLKAHASGTDNRQEGFLVRINSSGAPIKEKLVAGSRTSDIRLLHLGNNLFMTYWTKTSSVNDELFSRMYKVNLKKAGSQKSVADTAWIALVKLAKDPGSYQVGQARFGGLTGRYILPNGNYSGKAKILSSSIASGQGTAVAIPGGNEIFVVFLTGFRENLSAFVFKAR